MSRMFPISFQTHLLILSVPGASLEISLGVLGEVAEAAGGDTVLLSALTGKNCGANNLNHSAVNGLGAD